jgi:CRP/FNR family transcriptional regulator
MNRLDIMQKFAFFHEINPRVQAAMTEAGSIVNLKAGDYFVHEGGALEGVAIVGAGRLRVFKSSSTGREITLYEVRGGELCLVNVLSMMTDAPAPASARVEEDITALVVPNDRFRMWIGTEAPLRNFVFGVIAEGVVEVMNLVEEIAFKKLDLRLAEYLCQNIFVGQGQARELKMTHEAIAANLGSAREVISRLLKEFERQGALSLGRGRIAVVDQGVLKALAGRG